MRYSAMRSPVRRRWITLATGASLLLSLPMVTFAQQPERGPRADTPLAAEPKTPEELFSGMLLTLRLNRPEVARRYLETFLASKPSDEFLLKLRDQYGTSTFMQLARTKELQPASQTLMSRLQKIAQSRLQDTAVADRLIDQLSGTARERVEGLHELKHLREMAAAHLLRRVVSRGNPITPELATSTLVKLGPDVVWPLIGAMRTGSVRIQGIAADALGEIGGPEAELALWGAAFGVNRPDALKLEAKEGLTRILTGDTLDTNKVNPFGIPERLQRDAEQYLTGKKSLPVAEDGLVTVWTWDDAAGDLIPNRVAPANGNLFVAEQLARESLEMSGDRRDAQVLLTAILLARDVEAAGWDKPAPEGPGTAHNLLLAAGPDLAEDVLNYALTIKQPAAALQALRVLEQNGSRNRLHESAKGGVSPVLTALNSSEPRLQFAAAETILQWDPDQPFNGSQRVVEVLARVLVGNNRPDGVVIDPNTQRGTLVGDYLNTLGFDPRLASTGQDGFEMVSKRGDVSLAVIHLNSIRWELSQTVANLRTDPRTASVPIAIYGPVGMQSRVEHLTGYYPAVQYIEESNNATDLKKQLRGLLAQAAIPAPTDSQRGEQRQAAALWLQHLAETRRNDIFDLKAAEDALIQTANDSVLGDACLRTLSAIATRNAQSRLLDSSITDATSAEMRLTAARQLAFHIQRFGLLLTPGELDRLRSFESQETDPKMLTALTAVTGSLKPDAAVARDLLLSYPASTTPVQQSPAPEAKE